MRISELKKLLDIYDKNKQPDIADHDAILEIRKIAAEAKRDNKLSDEKINLLFPYIENFREIEDDFTLTIIIALACRLYPEEENFNTLHKLFEENQSRNNNEKFISVQGIFELVHFVTPLQRYRYKLIDTNFLNFESAMKLLPLSLQAKFLMFEKENNYSDYSKNLELGIIAKHFSSILESKPEDAKEYLSFLEEKEQGFVQLNLEFELMKLKQSTLPNYFVEFLLKDKTNDVGRVLKLLSYFEKMEDKAFYLGLLFASVTESFSHEELKALARLATKEDLSYFIKFLPEPYSLDDFIKSVTDPNLKKLLTTSLKYRDTFVQSANEAIHNKFPFNVPGIEKIVGDYAFFKNVSASASSQSSSSSPSSSTPSLQSDQSKENKRPK